MNQRANEQFWNRNSRRRVEGCLWNTCMVQEPFTPLALVNQVSPFRTLLKKASLQKASNENVSALKGCTISSSHKLTKYYCTLSGISLHLFIVIYARFINTMVIETEPTCRRKMTMEHLLCTRSDKD